MKKAYLINRKREDNSFNTFRIANNDSLEMIDLFTINFNNKEELVNYLKTLTNDISDNDDLYIIMNDGKNNLKIYDVLYSGDYNKDLEKTCMNSLSKKDLESYNIYYKVMDFYRIHNFRKLFRGYNFNLYKSFKEFIETGYNQNRLSLTSDNHWIRNSYYMYRNSILALNTYKELSNKNIDELDKIIRDKKSLDKERLQIENFYKQTLNNSFGQMSMFSNVKDFITITSIHPEKIPLKTKLVREKEEEKSPLSNIEITEAPLVAKEEEPRHVFKVDRESLKQINFYAKGEYRRKEATNNIMKFIYNMDSNIIKYDGDKYYINYDYFDLDISEEDKQFLNKMITQKMLQLISNYKRTVKLLNNDYLSYGSMSQLYEDKDYYSKEIRRYLDKYNIKSFNNIYKFFTQISKMNSIKKENGRSR